MRVSDLLEQELQAAVSLEGWELNSCSWKEQPLNYQPISNAMG